MGISPRRIATPHQAVVNAALGSDDYGVIRRKDGLRYDVAGKGSVMVFWTGKVNVVQRPGGSDELLRRVAGLGGQPLQHVTIVEGLKCNVR